MVADRLAALLDFLKEDPADPFLRFALATEYLKKGEDLLALEVFGQLVKDRPDYVGTYYHLAKLQGRLGKVDEARAVYEAGIREAARQGDRHSESELRSALMELDIDY
jgi:Tfp pilus assembly protein PilF